MEVEISEAEKTKCDRMFYWGFLGGFWFVRPFRIVFVGSVFWAPRAVRPFRIVFEPGGCMFIFCFDCCSVGVVNIGGSLTININYLFILY